MTKAPNEVIKAQAEGVYMQSVKRDFGLTQEQTTEIVFDFAFSGTTLSLGEFVQTQVGPIIAKQLEAQGR